jgi:hypothetical protein
MIDLIAVNIDEILTTCVGILIEKGSSGPTTFIEVADAEQVEHSLKTPLLARWLSTVADKNSVGVRGWSYSPGRHLYPLSNSCTLLFAIDRDCRYFIYTRHQIHHIL